MHSSKKIDFLKKYKAITIKRIYYIDLKGKAAYLVYINITLTTNSREKEVFCLNSINIASI